MKTIIAALMVSLVAASSVLAVPLYNQPWDGTGNALASQNDTSSGGQGNFATVYDNFTLGANSAIGNVAWTGAWFNPPAQGTITGFTISFWVDSAGQPGGLLQSYFISGNASETFLSPPGAFVTEVYSYSANLGSAFNALAGTQYWLSIVPDTTATTPQWGWATGTGGDGVAYQDFAGSRNAIATDFAFSLNSANGNALPEGGVTAVLLGSAVIGLVLLGKRFPFALS